MNLTQDNGMFNSGFDSEAEFYLLETTKWSRFLAIIGFIGLGFSLIGILFILLLGGFANTFMVAAGMPSSFFIIYAIVLLSILALYFYPIYCLFMFSRSIKIGIESRDSRMITLGLKYQKNMFRFLGILTIVVISIYLLVFLFGDFASISA